MMYAKWERLTTSLPHMYVKVYVLRQYEKKRLVIYDERKKLRSLLLLMTIQMIILVQQCNNVNV